MPTASEPEGDSIATAVLARFSSSRIPGGMEHSRFDPGQLAPSAIKKLLFLWANVYCMVRHALGSQ